MFTNQFICEALIPLIKMTTCFKLTAPKNWLTVKTIKYTIGEIKLKSTFEIVDLPIGKRFGKTDVVTIPVKCEYVTN